MPAINVELSPSSLGTSKWRCLNFGPPPVAPPKPAIAMMFSRCCSCCCSTSAPSLEGRLQRLERFREHVVRNQDLFRPPQPDRARAEDAAQRGLVFTPHAQQEHRQRRLAVLAFDGVVNDL